MMNLNDGIILLREFREDDIPNKIRWINNPENNQFLHYDIPLEFDKTLNWFINKNNETRLDLVIEYDNVPVGLIGLLGIDHCNHKAEYYICMGVTHYKGKGIATKASAILLEYGFQTLGLNKIFLNVDAENYIACHLYEKLGFVCEGYFSKDMIHHGKYIDRKRYAKFNENLA